MKKKEVGIVSERLKDERIKRHLTCKQLCKQVTEEYDYNLSSSKYSEMENQDDNENEKNQRNRDKDFGYKAFIMLASFFNVSTDYLFGLTDCRSTDIENRAASDTIGFDSATAEALLFWSKYPEKKEYKKIISLLIKQMSQELLDTIIEYRFREIAWNIIEEKVFKLYCEDNDLRHKDSRDDLSAKERHDLNEITKYVIDKMDADPDEAYYKLEKMIENIINSIGLDDLTVNKRIDYIHDYYDLDDPFGRIKHEFFEGKRKYMESGSFEAIDEGRINKKSQRNNLLFKNFDFGYDPEKHYQSELRKKNEEIRKRKENEKNK